MIDGILEHFGLDPYEARLSKNTWVVYRGTAVAIIAVIEPTPDGSPGLFAVTSRIVGVPKQNPVAMYRFLLEKNFATTKEARFAINDDEVYVVCVRTAEGLDPPEAARIIDAVAGFADEYDGYLMEEFGATELDPGK